LERIVPRPGPGGKQGIPTNVAVGTAVLIPIVIVVVVLGLVLSGYDKSTFEDYIARAQTAHDEALRLSGDNCENQALRPMWVEVLRLVELAEQYRPNDTNVLLIRADAQNYLDCYDGVLRRDLTLLHEFPADSGRADCARRRGPVHPRPETRRCLPRHAQREWQWPDDER
jgi:hypothetical protein